MGLYDSLNERKKNGEQLSLAEATYEELMELWSEDVTNKELAVLYDTSEGKVKYKRRKLGITIRTLSLESVLSDERRNEFAKDQMMKKADVDAFARALTHFAFRNGPVESMHARGQLSQADMKTLNKFMVNRTAYIFQCLFDKKWQELYFILDLYGVYGSSWDKAEPDDGKLREYLLMKLR